MQHISYKGDRTPIDFIVRKQNRKCTECGIREERQV